MTMTDAAPIPDPLLSAPETRSDRRKRRNRQALIDAGYQVMAEKGVDGATMLEIAERADVGAGTAYNYFASKEDLAVSVLEQVMARLARRIEAVTTDFSDPAQVYAFGCRTVMDAAITDQRWRGLLRRSEVIADAMYRVMGPFAIRDIGVAAAAGRFRVADPALAFRLATHALVGFSLAVCDHGLAPARVEEAVVALLGMVGVPPAEAQEIARRPRPPLPPE
jgi:AcrR family transcriptional regulator